MFVGFYLEDINECESDPCLNNGTLTDQISGLMFSLIGICLLVFEVNNGNRTMWSPIRSVIIRVISRESDLLITSMITDKIGRFEACYQLIILQFLRMLERTE